MVAGPSQRRQYMASAMALLVAAAVLAVPALVASTRPASALSELKKEEVPPPAAEGAAQPPQATPPPVTAPTVEVPLPDPMKPVIPDGDDEPDTGPQDEPSQDAAPAEDGDVTPDEEGGIARPSIDPNAPLPQVEYDIEKLPEPVKRMRNLLVEAAKSGDIEKLRALIGTGAHSTQLSLTEITDDPIAFLKSASGDPDGQEILAIMEEVLNAGYVHLNAGESEDIYVWPYFFGLPLDRLDARQRVEMFKIITAGDYEEMKTFGAYIFYRLGITPTGEWAFFVAGE
jgi:hypothetical protein